jgi:hypothetical protein
MLNGQAPMRAVYDRERGEAKGSNKGNEDLAPTPSLSNSRANLPSAFLASSRVRETLKGVTKGVQVGCGGCRRLM